jgi:hypothetical protein
MLHSVFRRARSEAGSTQFAFLGVIVALSLVVAAAIATVTVGHPRSVQPVARDASAQAVARRAVEAAYIVSGVHHGSYDHVGLLSLHKAAGVSFKPSSTSAWVSSASGHGQTFAATVTAPTGATYTVSRASDGTLSHTCKVAVSAAASSGCLHVDATGNGSW